MLLNVVDEDVIRKMVEALKGTDAALEAQIEEWAENTRSAQAKREKIRAAIAALAGVVDDEPVEFQGLADACRAVLKKHSKWLSASEVRGELEALGYPLKKHTNPMASIHSVLKRLADSPTGEIKVKEARDGSNKRYFWAGPREALSVDRPAVGSQSITETNFMLGGMPPPPAFGSLAKLVGDSQASMEPLIKAARAAEERWGELKNLFPTATAIADIVEQGNTLGSLNAFAASLVEKNAEINRALDKIKPDTTTMKTLSEIANLKIPKI